ncbi:putative bifunctional diguanylate cyclase/phosphodiesterase [Roseibium suaedae]|uniref:Diguanylate cyclase (GGDEF) domain-containing protein n=1 Tax=Roseibium suaedae TaxID=735517 RepID=A0A1M7H4B4_9HYPH|nr:EAL domain-containing protein [Roseibium suaedae]SHM23465.1 diguanylate cyclase (GGDEF) domain-containing protein [Roseibium suaedae]
MIASRARHNLVFGLSTLGLALALALCVYAANRVFSHWLLVRSLEQSLEQVQPTLLTTNQILEFQDLFAEPEPTVDSFGMRLTGTDPNSDEAAPKTLSAELTEVLEKLLSPSTSLAYTVVKDTDFTVGSPLNRQLTRFARSVGVPWQDLYLALAKLDTAGKPYTTVKLSNTGKLQTHSVVVIPNLVDGKPKGALLVGLDHDLRIADLEVIANVATLVLSALSIVSFLMAGLLLWLRFHDQVKKNRDIEFLAHHDALTGLPNRAVFNARLTEALRITHAKATNMGVMLIDVDKFKEINDTYGHATGDIFLQVIADRLRSVFSDHLVSRLSGDEFAVMFQSVADVARLTKLATDMISATKAPCVVDGKEIKISLSIGIARASDGNWRSSRVLHCADLALYRSKHSGRSTFSWYTAEMDADAQHRKEIEEGLAKALRLDQFDVLFQPQYALKDNRLTGYEALIRWEHPVKGRIPPDLFIPVAEDCGLIEDIGDWVLNRACQEAANWEDNTLKVAVNVSAAQFKPGITERKVANALRASGLKPERLEIEITESLLIANTDAVVETLKAIRNMGVAIAMDDFGTGYSSLSYLSRFPFDKIKIDKAFIQNLGDDTSTDAIVTSIIGLGRSLDVLITAEGVETENQVTLLRAAGCHLVQGYYFGKPDSVRNHQESRLRKQAEAVSRDLEATVPVVKSSSAAV